MVADHPTSCVSRSAYRSFILAHYILPSWHKNVPIPLAVRNGRNLRAHTLGGISALGSVLVFDALHPISFFSMLPVEERHFGDQRLCFSSTFLSRRRKENDKDGHWGGCIQMVAENRFSQLAPTKLRLVDYPAN